MVLIPYGVGVVAGASAVSFPPDYLQWTPLQKIVGILPGFLASAVRGVVGTAGGVLVGIVALSAVGIVSVGWHPFVVLRPQETRKGMGDGGPSRIPAPAIRVAEDEDEDEAVPAQRPSSSSRTRKSREPRAAAAVAAPPPPRAGVLLPPVELLNEPPAGAADADKVQIEEMGRRLVETLETFRVGGQIADKTVGPVVTRFELSPGPGVKVGRIAALGDDLALAMRARSLHRS
jgi:hypothetical protein